MSLATMITNLESARNAIVSAISAKGVELSPSATLYECAAAIEQITGGGGENMPTNGLVFHWSGKTRGAETGQDMSGSFLVQNGMGYFSGHDGLTSYNMTNIPSGNSPYTQSVWVLPTIESSKSYAFIYGSDSDNRAAVCRVDSRLIVAGGGYSWFVTGTTQITNKLTHCLITFDGSVFTVYQDGIAIGTSENAAFDCGSSGIALGVSLGNGERFTGYIAGARIYNRVVTEEEIKKLATEYDFQLEV